MFRFTIREMVLLTLVAAMGLAWWLRERHHSAKSERITERIATLEHDARLWRSHAEHVAEVMEQDGYDVQFSWSGTNIRRPTDKIPARELLKRESRGRLPDEN